MGNAVVTGTVDLAALEAVAGNLLLNGVVVSLASDSVDAVVGTINRFTPMTVVTASVGSGSTATAHSSDVPVAKHLILTSPADMRLDGDAATLSTLGLTGGVTAVSTEAAAKPAEAAPKPAVKPHHS